MDTQDLMLSPKLIFLVTSYLITVQFNEVMKCYWFLWKHFPQYEKIIHILSLFLPEGRILSIFPLPQS